jgi:hypothetical protein
MIRFFLVVLVASPLLQANGEKFVIGDFSKSGLFALFFGAVNNIVWAQKNGKIPVVYWGEDSLYFQKGGYHGQHNVWEYYFEPVSDLTYEPGDTIYRDYNAPDNVCIPPGWNMAHGQETYGRTFHESVKFEWHEAIQKNIRIKPWVTEKVEKFYQDHMAGKVVIGIHLRGTDKRAEVLQVPPTAIIERARQLAVSTGIKPWFFVATDEERLLNLAKKKLGADRVLAYDSIRSKNGEPLHWLNQNNNGQHGEQVLIETLLLAHCDYFMHTASNVATAVMLFNPWLKTTFLKYEPTRGLMIRTNP